MIAKYSICGRSNDYILIPERPGAEFSISAKYLRRLICVHYLLYRSSIHYMPTNMRAEDTEYACRGYRGHSGPCRVMTPHSQGWATPFQSIVNNTLLYHFTFLLLHLTQNCISSPNFNDCFFLFQFCLKLHQIQNVQISKPNKHLISLHRNSWWREVRRSLISNLLILFRSTLLPTT